MSRFVVYNGITRYKPGGITRVNADALNQVLPQTNGIVALIGEADGGAPGLVSGLVTHFDPSRGVREFRSGALVDAVGLAFQSSNDPDVPGGASRVLIWKTNQSTQAVTSLPTEEATFVIGGLAADTAEATGGGASTLIDTTLTGQFADDELNGKYLVIRPFTATAEVQLITDYVDATGVITVGSAWSVAPVALDDYWVLEPEVYDVSEVSGVGGTSVTWVNGGLTASEHVGRWVFIQNSAAPADTYLVQITANAVGTLTVTPSLPTLAAGAIAQILPNSIDLTTRDYGAHTNNVNIDVDDGTTQANSLVVTTEFEGTEQVSPEVGGVPFLKILYRGGAAAVSDTVAAVPVAPNTTTQIEVTTGGLVASAHVGQQLYSVELDEYTTITANTPTVLTLSPGFSAVPSATSSVQIRTVTSAFSEISGAAGVAASLATTIQGVPGDDLSIAFTAGMTLRQLVTAINANTNYVATIPNGINGDLSVAADFDFGPNTRLNIANSPNITSEGFRQDTAALVNYFGDQDAYATAVRASGGALDGCCPPNALASSVYFSGGTRGISSNTNFQEAFDALLLVRANSIIPLIDEDLVNEGLGSTATYASVSAQLGAHVVAARGVAQNEAGERGGFIGFQGTKSEIISASLAINDADVQLVAQNPQVLNAQGVLQTATPRMFAVMAASMRAGVKEVAEPLTHKYIRTSGLTQDASWEPSDTTDAAELILAGVLFAETIDGLGTRWVRDLTTYVQSDNLAYSEGSVRDAVRYVAYGLRTMLVNKFTGRKGTPVTAESAKDAAGSYLELLRGERIIVDSTDPTTGATIYAYHNLKVTISGDVLKVNVGVFPVPGINFILNDIFLQLPTQAA